MRSVLPGQARYTVLARVATSKSGAQGKGGLELDRSHGLPDLEVRLTVHAGFHIGSVCFPGMR